MREKFGSQMRGEPRMEGREWKEESKGAPKRAGNTRNHARYFAITPTLPRIHGDGQDL